MPLSRLELAKDVSALANSGGGLIVFGLSTKQRPQGDIIESAHPFPAERFRPSATRRALDAAIFPPVEDMTVALSQGRDGRFYALIRVPEQPPELRPFMVRGAIRDGQHLGTHVAVYERRGDGVREFSAERLHALIIAGRAAQVHGSPSRAARK